MHIMIYANAQSRAYRRLDRTIASMDLERAPELHQDVDQFCRRFRTMTVHPEMVILMPGAIEELDRLLKARDFFVDFHSIVILPDRGDVTISMGFKFRPRYITFDDDNFEEVTAILNHLNKSRLVAHNFTTTGRGQDSDHSDGFR